MTTALKTGLSALLSREEFTPLRFVLSRLLKYAEVARPVARFGMKKLGFGSV
jgi:hypothetical protein